MNIVYKCNSEAERLEIFQKLVELGWKVKDNIKHNSFDEYPYLNIDDEWYGDGIGYIFVYSSIAGNDTPTQVYCKEHILIPFEGKEMNKPKQETLLSPNRFDFTNKNLLVVMTRMSGVSWYFEVKLKQQMQDNVTTFKLNTKENELPDMDKVNKMVNHLVEFTKLVDEFSSEPK